MLEKYYSEPSKYSVEDGHIWCEGLWGIRLDNSQSEYVIVLLGDLGRDLPEKEQAHWKHYNVAPDGPVSDTALKRWYLGEFADPEDSALVFQQSFQQLQEAWQDKHGWSVFAPLPEADFHHFNTLRRPLTREQSELDEIILSLSKLLVDSINVRKLKELIPNFMATDDRRRTKRSIAILQEFLNSQDYDNCKTFVECLRTIQDLRSTGAAHRKGKKFEKAAQSIGLNTKTTQQVADEILKSLSDSLNSLREHFCPDDSD